MSFKILTLIFIMIHGTSLLASPFVIYGEDNRVEVSQTKNSLLRKAAYSTAAMIAREDLIPRQNETEITAPLFKEIYRLCPNERFKDQPAASNCSGTLIEKDIILTAGHCFNEPGLSCKGYSWVFDYMKSGRYIVSSSSVYKC